MAFRTKLPSGPDDADRIAVHAFGASLAALSGESVRGVSVGGSGDCVVRVNAGPDDEIRAHIAHLVGTDEDDVEKIEVPIA